MKTIFSARSTIKRWWDVLVVILTVAAAIEIPLHVVLGYELNGSLFLLDVAISICFVIDLLVNFRTAFFQAGKVVSDPKLIAKRYLRGWFTVDFLSALPLEAMLSFAGPAGVWIRAIRLIRLLRILKLPAFFRELQFQLPGDATGFKLGTFLFWFLLTAHWVACGWLQLDGIPADKFFGYERYLRAIYWCITTLATVGYGDITPQTPSQILYCVNVMILGIAVYGFIIGNVTSLLANLNAARNNYLSRIDRINAFVRHHGIPEEIQERIKSYEQYLWESRLGYDETEIIRHLPQSLKCDVSLHMHRKIIEKVPLFKGANEKILRELVLELRPYVIAPGDYIFHKGDEGAEMYFISRGAVQVVSGDGEVIFATLAEGSFFGEVALLLKQPRNASVRAADYTDLYVLPRTSFERVTSRYPDFHEKIVEQAKARTGEQK
jgi:hypothetical protein